MAAVDGELCTDAEVDHAASEEQCSARKLLDATSDGFCDLHLPEGIICNASQKLQATFRACKLNGSKSQDLVQEADHGMFDSLCTAAENKLELQPILLTCKSSDQDLNRIELFDVKITAYASGFDIICICLHFLGERRLLDRTSTEVQTPELHEAALQQVLECQAPSLDMTKLTHPARCAVGVPVTRLLPHSDDYSEGACLAAVAEVDVSLSGQVESVDDQGLEVSQAASFLPQMWVSSRSTDASSGVADVAGYGAASVPLKLDYHDHWDMLSTASDASSSASDSADIVITRPGYEHETATASAYKELRESGYASIGSIGHCDFTCEPCRFQYNHFKDPERVPGCRNTLFCGFCHAEHDGDYVKQKTLQKRYQKKKELRKIKQQRCLNESLSYTDDFEVSRNAIMGPTASVSSVLALQL